MNLIQVSLSTGLALWSDKEEETFEIRLNGRPLHKVLASKARAKKEALNLFEQTLKELPSEKV